MNRPPLEVADIIRSAGTSFLERSQRWLTWQHRKVLLAILRCRTATLGAHRDRCTDCGHIAISYNSCVMESICLWAALAMKHAHSNVCEVLRLPIRNRVLQLE